MAPITKLSSGKWKAIIKVAGRSKTKTFQLKSAAKAWAANAEKDQELAIALGSPGAALSIRQLSEEYLKQWAGKDASHPARVNWWVAQIGDKKLINVSAQIIRGLLEKYANDSALTYAGVDGYTRPRLRQTGKPRKPATVNRMQAALSSLFAYARKRGYVSRYPCSDVAGLTENNKIVRWLSDDERARLLVACRNSEWPKLHLLTIMALSTGARLGELQRLRWNMIDFKERTALLTDTKNGSDRVLGNLK